MHAMQTELYGEMLKRPSSGARDEKNWSPVPHHQAIHCNICNSLFLQISKSIHIGGASSAVRAQCNYLGVWPY